MNKTILILGGIISCFFLITMSYAGVEAMKLLKAGPEVAIVKYKSQTITCRKYYPKPGEPLYGAVTDMNYLSPCIGKGVAAIYDDKNREILGLNCPDNNYFVLVVPDQYLEK